MFYSSRLIYKLKGHARSSKEVQSQKAAQKGGVLKKCEDLKRNIELSSTFFGFVDGLFNRYNNFLDKNVSKKEREELHKVESHVTETIKKQFKEWLSSLDYCAVIPKEVESTMMRFYKCLESTVRISQAHVRGGMPKKNVYNDVRNFVKESPIGSDKITINSAPYASFTYNQKEVNWAPDAGKLNNIEASFHDISKGFNFRGKQNANDYIDKAMDAIGKHPNFNKMDCYTLLHVLGSFAEQTEHFTTAKNYSIKSAVAGITYHLDYL